MSPGTISFPTSKCALTAMLALMTAFKKQQQQQKHGYQSNTDHCSEEKTHLRLLHI